MNCVHRLFSVLIGLTACVDGLAAAAEPAQPVETTTLRNVFKLEGGALLRHGAGGRGRLS